MAFENTQKINIIGAPEIAVPSTMTVEQVLQTMNYNLSDYEQRVEGSTLILSAAAGSKGALENRIVDGRLLPVGGSTFPTDQDIELLASLPQFQDDNFFETVEDPAKLQEYYDYLTTNAEQILQDQAAAHRAKLEEDAKEAVAKLTEVLDAVTYYATKVGNPIQPAITSFVKDSIQKFENFAELAKASDIAALRAAREEEAEATLVEEVEMQIAADQD